MGEIATITHSDLKVFMACRRAWTWSQHDYRLPESPVGPMALGSRVHASLEVYYRDGLDPLAEHERLFREDLDGVTGWQEDQLYEDVIIGRRCLEAFMEWLATTGADDEYDVVSVEHKVEVPFLDGRAVLLGKIDVLFRRRSNGFLVINDIKTTGRWGANPRAALERSWQHPIYRIALSIAEPDEHIDGAYYTVIKKKPAQVDRFRVPGSAVTRPHVVRQLECVAEAMLDVPDVMSPATYPCPGDHCNWCEYRKPCELAQDNQAAAQDLLDREYRSGGKRLRRYDVL